MESCGLIGGKETSRTNNNKNHLVKYYETGKEKYVLKIKNSILSLLLIASTSLGGCSLISELKHTASKNMAIDKRLPIYELNKQNFKEITYKDKTYIIQKSVIKPGSLQKPIGRVSQSITINEKNEMLSKKELREVEILPNKKEEKRFHLNFGWVYSIKNISPDEKIAVVVNNEYRVAKIKK